MTLRTVTPENARNLLDQGAILVDIRESDEHARERIANARHLPLSKLDQRDVPLHDGKPVIFHCRSGARTLANSARLAASAGEACEAYMVEGGLDAWRKAGLPVVDLARERKELSENVEFEQEELAEIYVKRGVDQALARQVAQQLMAKDALSAHARDELGISEITTARPVQAALTSAATFAVGAAMPLLMVVISPASALVPLVSATSLGFLALLGAIGARAGGANVLRATARVTFWGAFAMALTAGIGKMFGTVV